MADQMFQVDCGFFVSIDHDRLYSAEEMNRPYKRIITNGVFATKSGYPSTDLEVFAYGNNMQVVVSPGEALFGDKWFKNAASLAINVPVNTNITPRIDSVIAQVDNRLVGRSGNIIYRTGTPSSSPTPPEINTVDNVIEYRLANISVGPGVNKILLSDITDCRGSHECPWVTSVIDQVDTTELFNQYMSAYSNFYNESTQEFDSWSAEKKAEFEQWLENLTEQLSVATNVIILSHNYLSTEPITTIPIGIPSYDKSVDALMVFINGLKVTEGLNYEVDTDGENIILTTEILSGQMVNFFVLKSVIAADVQTTATMIQELDAKVEELRETTDLIDSIVYKANGINDNIVLSDMVRNFYVDNYSTEKQLEIYVVGKLGVFNPYSVGTQIDMWFDFSANGSKSRVKLDFGNADVVSIDCTNSTNALGIFISGNIEIDNLMLDMRNCNTASAIAGEGLFHNCVFTLKEISGGSGDLSGTGFGTFYDCKFDIESGTGEAFCVIPAEVTVKLFNCVLMAYNLSGSDLKSVCVSTYNANTIIIMSGCYCPIEDKTGYKQDETVDINNGKFCLTGNILGKAASLYETGDGKTEVGTMIV